MQFSEEEERSFKEEWC